MKKIIFLIIFCISLFVSAQTDKEWLPKGKKDVVELTILKEYGLQKQNKKQLDTFSTIMGMVLKELDKKEVEKIYEMDITEKEKYLKIFEIYLDKIITE